jgi:hypothetical protein
VMTVCRKRVQVYRDQRRQLVRVFMTLSLSVHLEVQTKPVYQKLKGLACVKKAMGVPQTVQVDRVLRPQSTTRKATRCGRKHRRLGWGDVIYLSGTWYSGRRWCFKGG